MSKPGSEFDAMSPAERILYVQELWDRIAADPASVPVSDAQRKELARRREAHAEDPESALDWDEVRARLRSKQ